MSESDRDAIQSEVDQLVTEIERVSTTTKFNETYLLKGSSGGTAGKVAYPGTVAGVTIDATKGSGSVAVTSGANVSVGGTVVGTGKTVTVGGNTYTLVETSSKATMSVNQIAAELNKTPAVALSSSLPLTSRPLIPRFLALMAEMFRLILLSSEESAPTCRLKSIASFMFVKASIFNFRPPL